MNGNVHDHDALQELYETLLDYTAPAQAPMILVERLTDLAGRCGWDGEENAIAWSARRVAVYRRAIIN